MTRHENLKILAFIGSNAPGVVEYLTEKNYPKLSGIDMGSQIEHLANAGQHRIVTSAISDAESYRNLAHEFPGELHLVTVGEVPDDEVAKMAHYHTSNDPAAINELIEKLDFTL